MKAKIKGLGVILVLLVFCFCAAEINKGGNDLYAMDGGMGMKSFDFNTALTKLKTEKSPISLLNKSGEKDNARENAI